MHNIVNVLGVANGKFYVMYSTTLKGKKKGPCPGYQAVEGSCSGHPRGMGEPEARDTPTRATASVLGHTWLAEGHLIPLLNSLRPLQVLFPKGKPHPGHKGQLFVGKPI